MTSILVVVSIERHIMIRDEVFVSQPSVPPCDLKFCDGFGKIRSTLFGGVVPSNGNEEEEWL